MCSSSSGMPAKLNKSFEVGLSAGEGMFFVPLCAEAVICHTGGGRMLQGRPR